MSQTPNNDAQNRTWQEKATHEVRATPTNNSAQLSQESASQVSTVVAGGLAPAQHLLSTDQQLPQPAPPRRRGRDTTIIASVLAILLTVSGVLFGTTTYNNNQSIVLAHTTATAQAINARVTATAQAINARVTATAQASVQAATYPFSNTLLLNDPLVDNSKGVNWDSSESCSFSSNAYHAFEKQPGFYSPCVAESTNFTDFTFQVDMVIKQGGNGAAGGLVFRATGTQSMYYRLSIDQQGDYELLINVDTTGTNARSLKQGTASQFTTGLGQTNVIAVVALGNQISFYVNRQPVITVDDSTYTHGQIGVVASYGSSSTEVDYTNAEVWRLP